MMHRLLGAASVLALLSGCGGAVDSSSSDTSQNALSTGSESSADSTDAANTEARAKLEACFTAYATCVRDGTDAETCHSDLRACLPPPPHRGGHGDGDRGDCDGGPRPADGPPPPPPPGAGDGDRDGDRPPPPPDGDRDGEARRPPPPPCIVDLDACAKGTEAIATCVDAALGCFASLRHPPPPPPPGAPAPSGSSN